MKYRYWLANIPGIGCIKIERILKNCGSAEEAYRLSDKQLYGIYGLEEKDVEKIIAHRKQWNPDKEYEEFLEKGIGFVTSEEERYPSSLRNIHAAPYALYYKGKLPEEKRPAVAIVGARLCSDYGKAMAKTIAEALGEAGVQIISGMASGIDSYSHLGCLEGGGDTFAVLGSGADVCYPASSKNIYERIGKQGGIISEYAPGTEPRAGNFPMRNRIISGLADAVIVVEAKRKSGSLITADYALEQGKDIYVVPGRMTDALSGGTNRLIKQGAGIIVSVTDLMADLYLQTDKSVELSQNSKKLLEKEESLVYSNLDLLPKSMDELMKETGLEIDKISTVLLHLEHMGLAAEAFKNSYRRTY